MKEETGPQSIELVRSMALDKWKHSTYILHTGHLGTESSFWMKVAVYKVTKFFGSDLTLSMNSNAAGTGNGLACHVSWGRGEFGDTQTKVLIWLWN